MQRKVQIPRHDPLRPGLEPLQRLFQLPAVEEPARQQQAARQHHCGQNDLEHPQQVGQGRPVPGDLRKLEDGGLLSHLKYHAAGSGRLLQRAQPQDQGGAGRGRPRQTPEGDPEEGALESHALQPFHLYPTPQTVWMYSCLVQRPSLARILRMCSMTVSLLPSPSSPHTRS